MFLHFAIAVLDHYGHNECVVMKNAQCLLKPQKTPFILESDKQKELESELVLRTKICAAFSAN